jgi:hypothetical protein
MSSHWIFPFSSAFLIGGTGCLDYRSSRSPIKEKENKHGTSEERAKV